LLSLVGAGGQAPWGPVPWAGPLLHFTADSSAALQGLRRSVPVRYLSLFRLEPGSDSARPITDRRT